MSVFWCEGCQQSKDSDIVGYHDIDGKEYCYNCVVVGIHRIKPIPLITSKCVEVKTMLPEVDYDFFQEAIANAMEDEAEAIMKGYEKGDTNVGNYALGLFVRLQIEKYRQEIRDINDDQPLKRGNRD